MTSRWITLLLGIGLLAAPLQGQQAVVQGQFLFSGEETFSFGKYQYPLIEEELPILGEGRSDSLGRFQFQLSLSTPSFIHFKRAQDVYILYLEPGDSLSLKILNRFNIEFAGTRKEENEVFFQLGFNQDFYVEDPLEDALLAIDTLEAHRQAVLRTYRQNHKLANPGFLTYLQAAIVGNRYDMLNRLYHYHISEHPENPLLAVVFNELLDLSVVDEPRSATYLNACFAFIENKLNREKARDPALKEDAEEEWKRRRSITEQWTQNAPALARQLTFIQLAMQLWWVETKEDLSHFEASWTVVKEAFPEDEIHQILQSRYLDKRTVVLLQGLQDLSLLDTLGHPHRLSQLSQFPLISLLWTDSTELQEALSRLEDLLSSSLTSQQILTIYAGEEAAQWEKQRTTLPKSMAHFRLAKEDIDRLHTKFELRKYPLYLLFDKSGKVQEVDFAFTQKLYRAILLNRPDLR